MSEHKIITAFYLFKNVLVEGKARNKHRPVNERKSSYNCPKSIKKGLNIVHRLFQLKSVRIFFYLLLSDTFISHSTS